MTPIIGAPRQRGWYHGWNIVAACVLAQVAANGLALNAFSLFLHDWSAELHVGISALQALIMPFVFAGAAIAPFVGYFADKCPARWLFAGGLLGIAAFCLGISVSSSYWQIMMLYTVLLPPAVTLCTTITANALVSRWFVRRLGFALGLTAFGVGMAGVLLPPLVSYAIPLVGWRGVWRIAGLIIGVFVAPIVVFILRDQPGPKDGLCYLRVDESAAPRSHGHRIDAGTRGLNWLAIIQRRGFWLLVAVYIPILALYGASGNNLAPIVVARGFSRQTAALVLSIYSFSQVAGSLLMGVLADRFGSRIPFVGLATVTAAGAVVVAFGESLPVLAAGFVMIGLGAGLWPLLAAAIAAEFGAENSGRVLGLMICLMPLTSPASFAVAKIQEVTGQYAPSLLGMALLCVLGGGAAFLMRGRSAFGSRVQVEPPGVK